MKAGNASIKDHLKNANKRAATLGTDCIAKSYYGVGEAARIASRVGQKIKINYIGYTALVAKNEYLKTFNKCTMKVKKKEAKQEIKRSLKKLLSLNYKKVDEMEKEPLAKFDLSDREKEYLKEIEKNYKALLTMKVNSMTELIGSYERSFDKSCELEQKIGDRVPDELENNKYFKHQISLAKAIEDAKNDKGEDLDKIDKKIVNNDIEH